MFILNEQNTIANQFLAELRDINLQKDRARFRRNLERLGEIMAYEVSKGLSYSSLSIQTPLMQTEVKIPTEHPVLIAVLRAALPFYQGFLNIFDQSDSGFAGAYRKEADNKQEDLEIEFLYQATPSLENRTIIVVDPMLATGKSFIKTIQNLKSNGTPKMVHVVSVIASPEGVAYINQNLDIPFKIWTCALDQGLNEKYYILPGLGDAGDLCFGEKL